MEMLSNKWVATVASMWIQCSSGVYTFSVYSSVLKSSQGYDQSTLETVAVFRDIGSSAGVLSGCSDRCWLSHDYNNFGEHLQLPLWAHIFTFILLLLLLASPLGIAIQAQKDDSKGLLETFSFESNPSMETIESMGASSETLLAKDLAYHELPSGEAQVNVALDDKILFDEEGMNLLQAICTVNFWLFFYSNGMWNGLYAGCDKQLEPNRTISQLHYCGGE
nr:hypothetical protein CFP56_27545 [Quercus suber]